MASRPKCGSDVPDSARFRIYSSDPSSWASYTALIAVAIAVALAWWGSRAALAGQPLFGGLAIEEKEKLAS